MADCTQNCWSCNWCWLGRCMDASHYGQDVSVEERQPKDCEVYITKEDWNKQYVTPLSQERCMELLNALINHLSVAERNNEVIKCLLNVGFETEELITHFNFIEEDVKDAAEDMNDNED